MSVCRHELGGGGSIPQPPAIPILGVSFLIKVGVAHTASREREPITGIWERSLQWGPGAEPRSGSHGANPPEAESILFSGSANKAQICPFCYFDYTAVPCTFGKISSTGDFSANG